TFLLLDAILEAIDLFLQATVGFLELRALAKECEDAVVFRIRIVAAEFEKTELSQCFHERRGSLAPHLTGPRRVPWRLSRDGPAPSSIPTTCLASRYGPNADPVHAPRGHGACAGPDADARSPTLEPRRAGHRGRRGYACPDSPRARWRSGS